jgi:peptide methionine sulfoxide reductase MsrA
VVQLIYKSYFIRYRQALEHSFSAQKPCKEAREYNDSSCRKDSAPKKPESDQPCSVDEQSIKMLNDTAAEPCY